VLEESIKEFRATIGIVKAGTPTAPNHAVMITATSSVKLVLPDVLWSGSLRSGFILRAARGAMSAFHWSESPSTRDTVSIRSSNAERRSKINYPIERVNVVFTKRLIGGEPVWECPGIKAEDIRKRQPDNRGPRDPQPELPLAGTVTARVPATASTPPKTGQAELAARRLMEAFVALDRAGVAATYRGQPFDLNQFDLVMVRQVSLLGRG